MLRIITFCLITTFVSSSISAQTTTTDSAKAAAPAPALQRCGRGLRGGAQVSGEKTESATPQRRQKLKSEGKIGAKT